MSQMFVKGRTNNHLSWVMVDATDFATPESALSAAMKIKIYGKLRGATGVNFVSSGTGSLTNDIQHVGASVLGIYTIALAKADLSDASAAWYDQYVVSLSATGAAYQTLIVDGGIDASGLSTLISSMSDLRSYVVVMSGIQSDVYSALLLTQSLASDAASAAAQANSRVLLTQSLASDAASAAAQTNSRVLLNQSRISDVASYLVVMSGIQSDLYSLLSDLQSDFQSRVPKLVATNSQLSDLASDVKSAIAAITATIGASDISDIASAVWANTIGARVDSRLLVNKSVISDLYSLASDFQSDFQSRVPKLVATNSQLSDLASDVKSAVTANGASAIASDIYSLLSDFVSDFGSALAEPTAVPAANATIKAAIAFNHALNRNKITQTATVQSLRNDADNADICSAAVSDDGVTFIRGEFA